MGIFDWKHWVVILIVVVLVFGTKRLKNLGSDLGETIKGFRNAMGNDEDKAQDQAQQPAQPQQAQQAPAQPAQQPVQQQAAPQTIDVQAQKVEDPTRKD